MACVKTALFALVVSVASLAASPSAAAPRNIYEQDLVKAVQNHVDIYRSWDLDAFVDTFAVDAVVMLDGQTATGHAEIRSLYASNFADIPHSIKILESGLRRGMVYMTASYIFEDGYERCCSYSQYFVKDGKITLLKVTMTNRTYRTSKSEPE